MTGPGKDRLDFIAAINAVRYREYARVAWLKAGVIGRLVPDSEWGSRIFLSYTRDGDRSLETCQGVIDLFSDEVFAYHTPESMSCPVGGTGFLPVGALSARYGVDELARVSAGVEQPGVDYSQLRAYFFEELFDAHQGWFFAARRRYEEMDAAVVGMDDEVIGLFWLA